MDNLRRMIREVAEAQEKDWDFEDAAVVVHWKQVNRKQKIKFRRRRDSYEFRSTVLPAAQVTRTKRTRRELACRTWERNGQKSLVTFAFDKGDRLIGRIIHPVGTLDPDELVLYIEALAKECDRFEYLLTGGDRE